MKRLAPRLLLAVVLVAAIQAVAYTTRNAEIGPPKVDLGTMPFALGDWRGQDVEMDDLIFNQTRADLMVNREYADDNGHPIGITTSVFSDWHAGLEHHPKSCYKAAGFQLIDEQEVLLETAERHEFPAEILTYKQGPSQIQVLFWYQLGDHPVANRTELGRVRWGLPRGEPLPPLIKVMVQTAQEDREDAQDRLKGFAQLVLSFIDGSGEPSS